MATLVSLPPELLARILHLSNEGKSAEQQQRNRFTFGLVARALFLASAGATYFYVAGEKQAKALVAKLDREKKWAAQEARKAKSGRTTRSSVRITRVSNVRHLTVKLTDGTGLADLLRSTPNIQTFDLGLDHDHLKLQSHLEQLEAVFGTLKNLQKLRLSGNEHSLWKYPRILVRPLIPLTALQVLDLRNMACSGQVTVSEISRLKLPQLRELWAHVWREADPQIPAALASGTTAGLRALNLGSSPFERSVAKLPSFIPLSSSIVDFTWTPTREVVEKADRDAIITFLGAMTSVETLKVRMWTIGNPSDSFWRDNKTGQSNVYEGQPIDPSLFDTLTTLVHLRALTLVLGSAALDVALVASFIKAASPALRSLSIDASDTRGWSRKQWKRVRDAGEEAGVAFSIKVVGIGCSRVYL